VYWSWGWGVKVKELYCDKDKLAAVFAEDNEVGKKTEMFID